MQDRRLKPPPDIAAIRRRMEWFDRLPPPLRAVANGLPIPEHLLLSAIEAGCQTQEDAEAWMRRQVDAGVIPSPYK